MTRADLPFVVAETARRFGDAPALIGIDQILSYAELHRLSDEVAAGLSRRGVGEGSVVALTVPSGPDYVVAYIALAKLGALTGGINQRLAPPEQARVLDVLQPELVVDDVVRLPGEAPPELAHEEQRPVVVVFTSGTTGNPKGAVFTNAQLAAISSMDAGTAWGGGGAMLASTELCHVGFATKLPWHLRLGMRIHMLPRWRAADAMRVLSSQGIRTVGGIAAQVALMLRHPDFDAHDWSAVELVVVGGGPSPAAVIREARERFGAAYSVRYSSTESGGLGTLTAPDDPDDITFHTVGRPRPGIDLEIRNASNGVGEVWLRSPAQMAGYWRDPDATNEALVDGWLRTGDLGSLDDRGVLTLVGREKEMFIRGGYNVYPLEVEAVLIDHPRIAHVAVVARPDPVMGEIGVAVVVASDPQRPPELDDLRAFVRDRLAAYKLPEAIRVVDALPLNTSHKVDRRALTEHEREH